MDAIGCRTRLCRRMRTCRTCASRRVGHNVLVPSVAAVQRRRSASRLYTAVQAGAGGAPAARSGLAAASAGRLARCCRARGRSWTAAGARSSAVGCAVCATSWAGTARPGPVDGDGGVRAAAVASAPGLTVLLCAGAGVGPGAGAPRPRASLAREKDDERGRGSERHRSGLPGSGAGGQRDVVRGVALGRLRGARPRGRTCARLRVPSAALLARDRGPRRRRWSPTPGGDARALARRARRPGALEPASRRAPATWLIDWEDAGWAPPGTDEVYLGAVVRAMRPGPARPIPIRTEHDEARERLLRIVVRRPTSAGEQRLRTRLIRLLGG